MADRLSVSLFGNDLFNANRTVARTLPLLNGIATRQKTDTRTFGISLSYKILTPKKGSSMDNGQLTIDNAGHGPNDGYVLEKSP